MIAHIVSVRFHLSTMCLSVFLYFFVLSIVICLLFLWAMPPDDDDDDDDDENRGLYAAHRLN